LNPDRLHHKFSVLTNFVLWQLLNFGFGTIRGFDEASAPKGDAGRAPSLHHFRSWHLPYNSGKIAENPVRATKRCWASQCPARFVCSTWSSSSDVLNRLAGPRCSWLTRHAEWPTLGQRRYLPSCRTRGSPHQVTLSRNSPSELLRGRRRMEYPDPRESACYQGTKGHPHQSTTLGF
jgi:hypothetical protein